MVFAAQRRPADALQECDGARACDPKHVNALQGKAQALGQLGRRDLACQVLAKASVAAAEGSGAEQREQEQIGSS